MLTFTRSSDVYTQLCGIAGLVLPLSSPKRVFGNGICFNYVSLVFSQDVMASMAPHAMGRYYYRSYQVSVRLRVFSVGLGFNRQFTSAVLGGDICS